MAVSVAIVKLNDSGMQELLRSAGVQADMTRRAEAVAKAAGDGFVAKATPRRRRARAEAVTETYAARVSQAKRGTLIHAISAARR